jgi:hypothetical protein
VIVAVCAICVVLLTGACSSTSGPDEVTGDTEAPDVSITYPPSNAVIGNEVLITAEATDTRSVAVVELLVDGEPAGADSTHPYEFTWDASSEEIGSIHTLRARATDAAGNEGLSPEVVVHCRWVRLIGDSDEGWDTNLDRVFVRSTDTLLEFRVITYGNWEDVHSLDTGIDVGIFLDVDRNQATGLNQFIPGWCPPNDIGADYGAGVGFEGDILWRWDAADTLWVFHEDYVTSAIPETGRQFDVGIELADIGDPYDIDVVVVNALAFWDWAPDSGHATYVVNGLYLGESSSARGAALEPPADGSGRLWRRDRGR